MVNKRVSLNESTHDDGLGSESEETNGANTVPIRKWNNRKDAATRSSTPWITTVQMMASKATAKNEEMKKRDSEVSKELVNVDGMAVTAYNQQPSISFPFTMEGAEGFYDDENSPVSVTTVTSVSPAGDTMRTTMATKTSRTSRTSDENGKRVTQRKVQRIVVGQQRIVSPVKTFGGDQPNGSAEGSNLFDSLQPRTQEDVLSATMQGRPASHYGYGRHLPNSDPMLAERQGDDNTESNHQLDELDLAIDQTLQKTMENFQRMIEKEREQLLRLFPQLANSRVALADQAPATEIITERRVEPDGSVVEVQRVVTRQIVRVHKSVSMVNGIVQASAARAVVEYQGPEGGYRVKLEDTDAAVELSSETEEDDDADRASIAPSEFSDNISVIALPERKPSSIRNSSSAVAVRGDVVPSLQTSPKRKAEKAWYAAQELVESERRYVDKLRLLDQVFRTRVQQDPETAKTIGDDKLKKLFSNIGQLYSFHNDHLLPQLETRLDEWHTAQKICNVVRRLAPFLKIYSEYTSNYKKAIKTFEELRKRNKRFTAIIEQIEKLPECDHLPLSNHIICPIQRVTRYHLLMTEYLKNLHEAHPDNEDTSQALALTKEAAAHANNMMRQLDKYKHVIEVQELLGSQIHELLTPSRELIKQGQLMKISSRTGEHQQRYVFLFNDMLLLCSARRNMVMSAWGNKYKLRAIFEVGSMHVLEGDNLEVENTFYVRSGNKTVELYASAVKDKSDWMDTLWSVIQDHHKRMRSFRKGEVIETVEPDTGASTDSSPARTIMQSPEKGQSNSASGRCTGCSSSFKTFRKPRPCSSCGQNFCKKCCPKTKLSNTEKEQRLCGKCLEKMKTSSSAATTASPAPSTADSPERHGSTSPVSTSSAAADKDAADGSSSTQRIRRKSILEVKPTDTCIITGNLHMRLASRKWEERYFALHEDFVLYAFKSEKDVSARTSMPITGCRVALVDQRPDSTVSSKDSNAFKVEHKRRVYYFKAPTAQEMARWVAALDLSSQAVFPSPLG